ncbi:MAG: sacsin N-terminal ATP-binding-like domain-containing protein [Deltaproteobacteria bacterium]
MTPEFQVLTEIREDWVRINRKNKFEDGIKNLLTDLYPDNAHFIYELLQNAEDAQATWVMFSLLEDRIEFEHNGSRLFTLADVESITSIGGSAKRDDNTNIGKFGVGFKAVFAYTDTPEIHSGEFHFRIRDLVVPQEIESSASMSARMTKFVFPFNHPTMKKEQAVREIESALTSLGENTLLFLSNIEEIKYSLPGGARGYQKRVEREAGHINIQSGNRHSDWLRFQKNIDVVDEDGAGKPCRVAIAYSLAQNDDKKSKSRWRITPLSPGQVSIYFPAEKETSNLRFHIHAPFASTVARDSVRDCEPNKKLRDGIAELIVESLSYIRDVGMLTMSFLAVMPNRDDPLADFYEGIHKRIANAFKEQALTPTKSGGYAPAKGLYRGAVAIANVIDDVDLSFFTKSAPPLWVANAPQKSQREDKFLDSLEIREWSFAELAQAVSKPHPSPSFYNYEKEKKNENAKHRRRIEKWIVGKDDSWLMRFYALLEDSYEHKEKVNMPEYPIVRVAADDGQDEQVAAHKAFFPADADAASERTKPANVRFVKPEVYSAGQGGEREKNAKAFLVRLGVKPYNEREAIRQILRKNYKGNLTKEVKDSHFDDLGKFTAYWRKNPADAELFKSYSFIRDDKPSWQMPKDVCLDEPLEATGLAELTPIHGKLPVWSRYKEKLSQPQMNDFIAFLKALGVMCELKVEKASFHKNPTWPSLNQGGMMPKHCTDEDYTIPNLEQYLMAESVTASRLVWNALIKAETRHAKARYRLNSKYSIREADSQLVCHLKGRAEWIPNKSGEFCGAQDMTKDSLRTDFPYDDRNGLLTAIGFAERAKKRSEEYVRKDAWAEENGFGSAEELDKWRQVREAGISPDEILANHQKASLPEESVKDPERRRKAVLEESEDAPDRQSVKCERSIIPGTDTVIAEAKTYLRAKYTNSDEELVCQCCHGEMPFKVKVNGGEEYYFEAVQCVRELTKHYPQNRLALCPLCAAMYKHARETGDETLRRRISSRDAADTDSSVEIQVRLEKSEFRLRFVGTHWFDLKTVLEGDEPSGS